MEARKGILLESGTNEVEMLEFDLAGQGFGVNVLKIQAIEQYDPEKVTRVQLAHPAVIGSYSFRDTVVTLVDLGRVLDLDGQGTAPAPRTDAAVAEAVDLVVAATGEVAPAVGVPGGEAAEPAPASGAEFRIVLVMEFNGLITAFLADGVNRIHRVGWDAISALSPYLAAGSSKFTGSLHIDDREVLILDMERIVAEILPRSQNLFRVEQSPDHPLFARRADAVLILAEDSPTIRETVARELGRGNYVQLHACANGREALAAIEKLEDRARSEGRALTDLLQAVITDIEMPEMDGLALCRTLKQARGHADLPVIVFSSLINDQITRKCEAVAADATISKPQFGELISLLDRHIYGVAG